MDGNGERPQRTSLPSEIALTPHLNNELPRTASCHAITCPGNGSGAAPTQHGSDHTLSNDIRPPVYTNGSGAYGQNGAKADEKYVNPPSYEEAIKYMSHIPPDDANYLRPHQIDNGQFALSEPYFSPRQYEESELDADLTKSACLKLVKLIVFVILMSFCLRIFFARL